MSSHWLPVIAEKSLSHATKPRLSVFCSRHDLIAVPTDNNDLVVYRLNGQTAFTIKRRPGSEAEITAVQWKPDGASIAIGWSDGSYAVHSGENGRLLTQGSIRLKTNSREKEWKLDLVPDLPDDDDDEDGAAVASFGWEIHSLLSFAQNRGALHTTGAQSTTEDWYDHDASLRFDTDVAGDQFHQAAADLPATITLLDATEVLPRLSAIPNHGLPLVKAGVDGVKFSSQAATDAVFQPHHAADSGSVDVLLVTSSDGKSLVLMDESVSIGTVDIAAKPLLHTSHCQSASHAMVFGADDGLRLAIIDLPLNILGSPLLHVITKNTKRIQDLLAYISHTIRCCQHDYTTGLAFPIRLINNIAAELTEKTEGDLVSNLFHLAMTGDFTPTVLEWLTDVVKEPNHKRWHVAVDTMYSHLQDHIFMHLLLALDRLTLAVTTLRGYAVFHEGSTSFDVPQHYFTNILSGVDALRVVAHKLQLIIMTEMRQFRAFSKWLQVMIEVGSAGPFTKSALETEEREYSNLDYPLILAYIEKTLMKSSVEQHLVLPTNLKGSCSREAWFSNPAIAEVNYEAVVEATKRKDEAMNDRKQQSRNDGGADASLNLSVLAVHLNGHVRECRERITAWQSAMLKPPTFMDLRHGNQQTRILDTRLILNEEQQLSEVVIAAFNPKTADVINILVVDHKAQRLTSHQHIKCLQNTASLLDARITADHKLLALWENQDTGHRLVEMSWEHPGLTSTQSQPSTHKVLHDFDTNSAFQPSTIQVGERKGKEVCVVYASSGKGWQILDISDRAREMHLERGAQENEVMEDSMDVG